MTKTMWIANLGGLMIPGKVLGASAVATIDPGEAVEVPVSYGSSLVADGLAYEVDEPDTEPASQDSGEDEYAAMSKDELEAIAGEFGYNPPGNIKRETLRDKVRKLVADKFAEVEAKAKELGIQPGEDWTIEEYEAAIEEASK